MSQKRRWHIYPNADALRERAAAAILRLAREAIASHGEFNLVLAGGDTPRAMYRNLAQAEADWSRWNVYFGDERVAAVRDPQRNSAMAYSAWLDAQPGIKVYPIPTELGAERAAAEYARIVSGVRFDLVLLGLGEDGHTASLFRSENCTAAGETLVIYDAPKPPPQRVSLTAHCLSRAAAVWFLVSGAAKSAAVSRWRKGEAIPAAAIAPPGGVDIMLEQAAYA